MGQQALFDPVMIKKWGNCEPKSRYFRGHFPLHFFDSMTAFVNGFSFEGDVLICQDLTKLNPVYNKPEQLAGVLSGAFAEWDGGEYEAAQ